MESFNHCDVDQMISRNVSGSGTFDGFLEPSSVGPTSSSTHSFLPHHHFTTKINLFHSTTNVQNGYSQVMISNSMKTIGDCDTVNNNNNHHLNHLPHLNNQHQIKEEKEQGGYESTINSAVQSDPHLPEEKLQQQQEDGYNQHEPNNLETNHGVEEEDETPEIDIKISNVVSNFTCRCHLNLKNIAMRGSNVVYKREQGVVSMKIRNPPATASIWSSGKVSVIGSNSEANAKISARKIARILQKMGYKVRMSGFRVCNVLGIVDFPFGIKLKQFAQTYPKICSYEPELHPGATYKCGDIKASLTIFQTGAITITAPSVAAVEEAVEHIYPLVHDFQKDKPQDKHLAHMRHKKELIDQGKEVVEGTGSSKRKKHQTHNKNNKRVRTDHGIGGVEDGGSDLESMIDDDSADEFGGKFTSESEAKSTSEESSDDE